MSSVHLCLQALLCMHTKPFIPTAKLHRVFLPYVDCFFTCRKQTRTHPGALHPGSHLPQSLQPNLSLTVAFAKCQNGVLLLLSFPTVRIVSRPWSPVTPGRSVVTILQKQLVLPRGSKLLLCALKALDNLTLHSRSFITPAHSLVPPSLTYT